MKDSQRAHEQVLAVSKFIKIFKEHQDNIEELLMSLKDVYFVKPIALAIIRTYLKEHQDKMNYLTVFYCVMLCLKFEDGDVCLRLNEESLFKIFNEKLCPNLNLVLEDEALSKSFTDFKDEVKAFCRAILDDTKSKLIISNEVIAQDSNIADAPFVVYKLGTDEARIYFHQNFKFEKECCDFIKNQTNSFVDDEYATYLKTTLDTLFDDSKDVINYQKLAAAVSAINNFSVICGGPGTGKTTTVIKLLVLLLTYAVKQDKRLNISLAAPTGKAAARMVESIQNSLKSQRFKDSFASVCKAQEVSAEQILEQIPNTASTVHKLLRIIPHNGIPPVNADNPLACDILIVDEVSMISLSLFDKLVNALGPNTKLILLGDKDQLSSVEPGVVFADLCSVLNLKNPVSKSNLKLLSTITGYAEDHLLSSHNVANHVARLAVSYRFSETSKLGKLANAVNSEVVGDTKDFINYEIASADELFADNNEVSFLKVDENLGYKALNKLATSIAKNSFDVYSRTINPQSNSSQNISSQSQNLGFIDFLRSKDFVIDNESDANLAFDKLNTFRVLCSNREGPLGTYNLNDLIAHELLEDSKIKNAKSGDFMPGLVVLITKNDAMLNLENGDVGFVCFKSADDKKQKKLKILFPAKEQKHNGQALGSIREVSPERIADYETGFAMTIHKSQGSEYQNICMVLSNRENPVISKELIYTGLTRAKSGGVVKIVSSVEVFNTGCNKKVSRESGMSVMLKD